MAILGDGFAHERVVLEQLEGHRGAGHPVASAQRAEDVVEHGDLVVVVVAEIGGGGERGVVGHGRRFWQRSSLVP